MQLEVELLCSTMAESLYDSTIWWLATVGNSQGGVWKPCLYFRCRLNLRQACELLEHHVLLALVKNCARHRDVGIRACKDVLNAKTSKFLVCRCKISLRPRSLHGHPINLERYREGY